MNAACGSATQPDLVATWGTAVERSAHGHLSWPFEASE